MKVMNPTCCFSLFHFKHTFALQALSLLIILGLQITMASDNFLIFSEMIFKVYTPWE